MEILIKLIYNYEKWGEALFSFDTIRIMRKMNEKRVKGRRVLNSHFIFV